MLRFARSCVGKPFSGSAMARSLLWPRQTDNKSFFCAGTSLPPCKLVLPAQRFKRILRPRSCPSFAQNSSRPCSKRAV